MKTSSQGKELDVVATFQEKLKGMQKMIDSSLVTTDEELSGVSDKIKNIKTLKKYIENAKDEYVAPAKAIIAKARETYDPAIKECENAELILKGRAKKFIDDKEIKRLKKEAEIANKVETGKMSVEKAVDKLETLPDQQSTVRTPDSGLRISKRSVAVIVDANKIPDEYWVIDEVRVRREALILHKDGKIQIPGVEIREESSIASV